MEFPQRARKFVATHLALIAGIGMGSAISYELGIAPDVSQIGHDVSRIAGITPACPTPEPSTMHAVDELFSQPPLHTRPPYSDETYQESSAEIAQKFKLTLPSPYLNNKLVHAPESKPFAWDFTVAGAYLAQFGVKLSVAGPHQFDGSIGSMPTRAELNNSPTKYILEDITGGLRSLPLQYVRATGLKHVVITDLSGHNAGMALTDGKDNTILIDPRAGSDMMTIGHEMEHLIDARECGAPANEVTDPAYTSLNGGDIYNNGDQTKDNGEVTVTGKLAKDWHDAMFATSRPVFCREEEIFDKALPRTVAFSDYGLTNATEDKAEMASILDFPTQYSEVLDPKKPIIRKKFELIMARLYDVNPRLVKYFAAVSNRPSKTFDTFRRHCPNEK